MNRELVFYGECWIIFSSKHVLNGSLLVYLFYQFPSWSAIISILCCIICWATFCIFPGCNIVLTFRVAVTKSLFLILCFVRFRYIPPVWGWLLGFWTTFFLRDEVEHYAKQLYHLINQHHTPLSPFLQVVGLTCWNQVHAS
jgi:hypothetical protein